MKFVFSQSAAVDENIAESMRPKGDKYDVIANFASN